MARTLDPVIGGHTCAPDVLAVDEHVARNPIARAVARQRLDTAVRAFAIRLHMLHDGELVQADGLAAMRAIYVAHLVLQVRQQADTPAARVMHGAISALQALAERHWHWRVADATAIDQAMQRAQAVMHCATAQEVQAAWLQLARLDAEVNGGTYAR